VVQAQRFLARRGWTIGAARGGLRPGVFGRSTKVPADKIQTQAETPTQGSAIWQPLGPVAVQSQSFGLVTGRVSALALDPSDATGNTLYVGTTGGGVWRSQNVDTSDASNISFIPLTDNVPALNNVTEASISIGALAVQPGATGVILAGTGDPNDALDSYYGAGILRSTDGGGSWSLISTTSDQLYSFVGEGFAGFAWSTVNTQLVVAAVSQAYEGMLVNAAASGTSYEGLYYSSDGGASWSLATITDGPGEDIQGPNLHFVLRDGNAATSVVWNPVRQLFIAAVRFHGYYQSADGITWTRMAAQPGAGLMTSSELCPANTDGIGSIGCPIFRGTLAVNPQTGDTFAWTVDIANQDQGIWQDECAASAGACASQTVWTALQTQQWNTAALETETIHGPATIENGDYNLALGAVPAGIGQQYGTILLAGANDLWKTDCPYSQGCPWRNTTNSTVGFCAQVGEYQHALAWNAANPLEILVGNDSGLWRSTDAIAETGEVCSTSDAAHFQNLNGSIGSLAEVVTIPQVGSTPYTMMAGLGVNGTAGVKNTSGPTADWPEVLGGEGGPVEIDPQNEANWFVNNQAGVSIYLCSQESPCTPAAFGSAPVVNDADVGGDGLTMTEPAPFLVDPLDSSQLLIGTCRVWRGETSGMEWTSANAISPMLDGSDSPYCNGDALIRSMAAQALPTGNEVIYVGMDGSLDGGATLAGHVLSAVFDPASSAGPVWTDLSFNPVTNDTNAMNLYGLDISSIFIDPHDSSGETVYLTVAGIRNRLEKVEAVYGSTDGGAHWTALTSNLIATPANGLVVDPQDAGTVYLATDAGVYSTRQIASCNIENPGCWAPFGSGLPEAPVVALSAQPASASEHNLIAATYGRGLWIAPLLGAGGGCPGQAIDPLSPASLTFSGTVVGQLSAAQPVTLTNCGSLDLTSITISVSWTGTGAAPFQQSNNCTATLGANSSCTISVQFAPTAGTTQAGTLSVGDITRSTPQTVELSGTGIAAAAIGVSPASMTFPGQQVGVASVPQTLTVTNIGGSPMAGVGFEITPLSGASFTMGANNCAGATLANGSSCTVQVTFTPAASGGATASLAVSSSTSGVAPVGVLLTGAGQSAEGINVSPAQLVFGIVAPGQSSASQTVTITNSGGSAVNALALNATLPFSLVAAANSCGASLAAGASCSTGVVFSPSLAGSFTGALSVASGGQTVASVPLSGTGGTPGAVEAQPGQIDFPQTSAGQVSSPIAVTLTNPVGDVSLSNFTVAATAGFIVTSNSCPSTFVAGATCAVGVEFQPSGSGTQSGSLSVSSSVLAAEAVASLSGMGFDFTVAFSGSSSQTVASGQTASYQLAITPLGGSTGSFTLQCGSLPSNSYCTFNPSGETIPASTTGNELVEIATGLPSSSAELSRPPRWPLACVLVLVPMALWRRRRALLFVAALAMLACGVSSCTSSGGGLTQPPPHSGLTPAGTYSIPVTVSANGLQHQITVTLVVD
jgi:hypothetical protein